MAPKRQTKKAPSPKNPRVSKTREQRVAEAVRSHSYVHVKVVHDDKGAVVMDGATPKVKYSEVSITGYDRFWIPAKPRSPTATTKPRPSTYNPNFVYIRDGPYANMAGDWALLQQKYGLSNTTNAWTSRNLDVEGKPDDALMAEIERVAELRSKEGGSSYVPLSEIIALGNHVLSLGEAKKAASPKKASSPRGAGPAAHFRAFYDNAVKADKWVDVGNLDPVKGTKGKSYTVDKLPAGYEKVGSNMFITTTRNKEKHQQGAALAKQFLAETAASPRQVVATGLPSPRQVIATGLPSPRPQQIAPLPVRQSPGRAPTQMNLPALPQLGGAAGQRPAFPVGGAGGLAPLSGFGGTMQLPNLPALPQLGGGARPF